MVLFNSSKEKYTAEDTKMEEKRTIRKIMEKDAAVEILNNIKNKICDIDLDDLCGDTVSTQEGTSKTIYNRIIQAIQCGLVYWDDNENCMVQELIHPITSGTIKADKLCYKNNITLGDAKEFKSTNQAELIIKSLANITGKGFQIIEKIRGQDLDIASGCMSFFDK